MHCPKCYSESKVKNGIIKDIQRYKCRECGCNYTKSSRFRIDVEQRAYAIKLYLEGVGFRGIERLTGISNVTVMRWVRALGDKIERERPEEQGEVAIMELDEMWHFIGKKNKNAGCGLRMTVMEDESVPHSLVAVTEIQLQNYGSN